MTITMIKNEMELKIGTKTVFNTVKTTEEIITEEAYKNIIDAKSFFRKAGCKEYHAKSHTKAGLVVTRILTTHPDRKSKTERMFAFA